MSGRDARTRGASATLDVLSGGRFTLGLGVGAREDDFRAVGADHATRGRRMDEQLATMCRVWAGEPVAQGTAPIGPAPVSEGGPELLFGGFVPRALARVAHRGAGYACPAPPRYAATSSRSTGSPTCWRDRSAASGERVTSTGRDRHGEWPPGRCLTSRARLPPVAVAHDQRRGEPRPSGSGSSRSQHQRIRPRRRP
ncbi:LLM class flavin-dependent oxidoreductase [Nonomuraea terrae]|uniref:LLM class flavin-dependent oxidoreductase n=1 Tax=Nonomuraea terrae TaxID=2530383 RepID=UPI0024823074|nr:LLM class flavin-dependent oxidoreductase [Nonomuraea terrae]